MDIKGEDFLQRKFLHLYNCFDQDKKGFIEQKDAELQSKKLLKILRRQLEEGGGGGGGMKDKEEIERRVEEFNAQWMPGAMKYFFEMSRFSTKEEAGAEKITKNDFIAFKMSIRDHILQTNALPSWFEDSLRMSFSKCWAKTETGLLEEEGLELLPGVVNETRTSCHHLLTDNNNKKINVSDFIALIKEYYSIDDPQHISKYIHGYEEN